MNNIYLDNAGAICQVLSVFFCCELTKNSADDVDDILSCWPSIRTPIDSVIEEMRNSIKFNDYEKLRKDYYRLFIGPGVKMAYPWGSVYTDKDNLLCGESCDDFLTFCKKNSIKVNCEKRQPIDHVGVIIAVLSYLLENNKVLLSNELIVNHLEPWLDKFLSCVYEHADTKFYYGCAKLVDIVIADLKYLFCIEQVLLSKRVS